MFLINMGQPERCVLISRSFPWPVHSQKLVKMHSIVNIQYVLIVANNTFLKATFTIWWTLRFRISFSLLIDFTRTKNFGINYLCTESLLSIPLFLHFYNCRNNVSFVILILTCLWKVLANHNFSGSGGEEMRRYDWREIDLSFWRFCSPKEEIWVYTKFKIRW